MEIIVCQLTCEKLRRLTVVTSPIANKSSVVTGKIMSYLENDSSCTHVDIQGVTKPTVFSEYESAENKVNSKNKILRFVLGY